MVAQLPRQTWAVSGLVGGGALGVYDSTGALVSTIGRSGRGPGEYGTDLHVVVDPSAEAIDSGAGDTGTQEPAPDKEPSKSSPWSFKGTRSEYRSQICSVYRFPAANRLYAVAQRSERERGLAGFRAMLADEE